MREVATIQFTDDDSGDEAIVTVGGGERRVSLTLPLRHDGDVMVVMKISDFHGLLSTLQQAAVIAEQQP